MAVRIRVYPQYGGLGMNGLGMNRGGAVSAATYYNSKLTTQKQVSSLQLGYERALANERIERARLYDQATWNHDGSSWMLPLLDLAEALVERVKSDQAICGLVITSGKPAFCAGADLTALQDRLENWHLLQELAGLR